MVVREGNMNVHITCDHGTQREDAPFWRINGNVYDIFHVPSYFRVDSFTHLTIPVVNISLNDSTFQCIFIDHETDPVTEIPGRRTILTVHVSGKTSLLWKLLARYFLCTL